jgi:hypothetical protein
MCTMQSSEPIDDVLRARAKDRRRAHASITACREQIAVPTVRCR